MRAVVCSRLEGIDSLEVGELPAPEVARGQVRLQVAAAGVNFPDLLLIRGLYQEKPPLPFAPGMEVAGTVTEVGEGVEGVEVGARVCAFVTHGGFAEQLVAPASALWPVPSDMPLEKAAAIPIVYGTGYHALFDRARLGAEETLLVLGAAGGVGLAAVQMGAAAGARVIAAVSSEEKAETTRRAGAAETIRYDIEDLRERLRELAPAGVDVVYDPVGGPVTEAAFRSLAWNGRHLVIGFAAGEIPALPTNLALLKGASLVGVFWGRFASLHPEANRANFDRLATWWEQGRIDPLIGGVYPLEEATEALRLVESRRAIGKLIVAP